MNVPAWMWVASAAVLIAVVAAEAVLTRRGGADGFAVRRAAAWAGVYVSLAVLFGLALAMTAGWTPAGQFYAGYLTEYSLSLDNLFVFYVIMSWFAVPPGRQHRVLLLGIAMAIVLRSGFIVAGVTAVSHFDWFFYPLGAILVWTAIGLLTGRPDDVAQGGRLLSWLRRRAASEGGDHHTAWGSGGLLLLVTVIGVADVLFAFDSIPAVIGITTNAYLIVACNALALMGLRQVYVLLVRLIDRIAYLDLGLGIICAFIGAKLLLQALRGSGLQWAVQIPAWLSVVVVAGILLVTVVAGLLRSRQGAVITAGERAVLERRFDVVDTDGNGVWQRHDYEQLTRRLCEAFGHAAGSAVGRAVSAGLRALFDAMLLRAAASEELGREEFVATVRRPVQDRIGFDAAVTTAARALIRVADIDGNGVLDTQEYAQLAAVYGAGADEAAQAFRQLDTDHNGVLDTTELAAAIGQFFTSRDARSTGNFAFGGLL
jgi:tellurite resistance protein TerC